MRQQRSSHLGVRDLSRDGGVTLGDLQFDVTQDLGAIQGGTSSELTQTYAIKNLAASTQLLVLVRHVDGDLQFDGSIAEGGGASADGSVLYEFDASDDPASRSTFVGISGALGSNEVPNRWTIKPYDYRPTIEGEGAIPATDNGVVHNDTNNDRIVGTPFDVTVSQQWNAMVAAGATQTFTTRTSFRPAGSYPKPQRGRRQPHDARGHTR